MAEPLEGSDERVDEYEDGDCEEYVGADPLQGVAGEALCAALAVPGDEDRGRGERRDDGKSRSEAVAQATRAASELTVMTRRLVPRAWRGALPGVWKRAFGRADRL